MGLYTGRSDARFDHDAFVHVTLFVAGTWAVAPSQFPGPRAAPNDTPLKFSTTPLGAIIVYEAPCIPTGHR